MEETYSKEDILKMVKNGRLNNLCINIIKEKYSDDKEFMLELVSVDGHLLRYASEDLKADKDIVLVAVKKYEHALEYASQELRDDKEFMLELVSADGHLLRYVSEDLKADKNIVLAAVKKNGFALNYASQELRDDEEVVLEAIKTSTGYAFKYASPRLREDPKFGFKAISEQGMALEWASSELRTNEKANLTALKTSLGAIRFADVLRDDEEIMSAYCDIDGAFGTVATDRIKQKWDRIGKNWREQGSLGEDEEKNKRKLAELIDSRLESLELAEHSTDGHGSHSIEEQMQEALSTGDYRTYMSLFDNLSPEEKINAIINVQSKYRAEKSARTPLAQREANLRQEEQISSMIGDVEKEIDEPGQDIED